MQCRSTFRSPRSLDLASFIYSNIKILRSFYSREPRKLDLQARMTLARECSAYLHQPCSSRQLSANSSARDQRDMSIPWPIRLQPFSHCSAHAVQTQQSPAQLSHRAAMLSCSALHHTLSPSQPFSFSRHDRYLPRMALPTYAHGLHGGAHRFYAGEGGRLDAGTWLSGSGLRWGCGSGLLGSDGSLGRRGLGGGVPSLMAQVRPMEPAEPKVIARTRGKIKYLLEGNIFVRL